MDYSLQKASIWKRAAAWLLDAILVCILATGFGFLLSSLLDYDSYNRTLNDGYSHYEELYGVSFEISYEEHEALSSDARQNWDNAYNALIQDKDVMYAYNMVINLTMIIVTIGILLGVLVLEFAVPLFLGNGQTLGKKMFGICLMNTNGVKINSLQLLTRTLLGKYT
ncbi:MAG: RDD family protein, partial [Clostridia bacterium]|nr:RDD family protein [Clostridia bacterium]